VPRSKNSGSTTRSWWARKMLFSPGSTTSSPSPTGALRPPGLWRATASQVARLS
jgi:hypothetical protein